MKRKELHRVIWIILCVMIIISMVFFTVAPYVTTTA